MNIARWEKEQAEIVAAYPSARWGSSTRLGARYEAWTLRVDPVPAAAELPLVLADLATGRTIGVGRDGRIAHLDGCPIALEEHKRPVPVTLQGQQFEVELVYPGRERGRAGPVHPQLRVLSPEISARAYPQHPHLFRDGDDSWACAVAPHDSDWGWAAGGTVRYLDHACIWLLKSLIWIRTGGGILGFGKWIGSQAPHDAAALIAIDPAAPCRYGCGRPYAACHRPLDLGGIIDLLLVGQQSAFTTASPHPNQ